MNKKGHGGGLVLADTEVLVAFILVIPIALFIGYLGVLFGWYEVVPTSEWPLKNWIFVIVVIIFSGFLSYQLLKLWHKLNESKGTKLN